MEQAITKLYELRFNKEIDKRYAIWKILCTDFFQKYVKKTDTVCDIGAGYCEFINNIKAKHKIAVDINPSIKKYAKKNVKTIICSGTKMPKNMTAKVDLVFASNFFEHLPTKEALVVTLKEVFRILKKGGKFVILMPNIRYTGAKYWDFLDHQLPLTERSMIEALILQHFSILESKKKFLPYSTKSNYPKLPVLVKLYLKMSFFQLIFGEQSLIVAIK